MDRQNIESKEALKRFHCIPKAKSENKPSKAMVEKMKSRRTIEIIEEANAIGCSVEDLM